MHSFIAADHDQTVLKSENHWRNYTVGPSSLLYVRNWSLKFQVSAISSLSFKMSHISPSVNFRY